MNENLNVHIIPLRCFDTYCIDVAHASKRKLKLIEYREIRALTHAHTRACAETRGTP